MSNDPEAAKLIRQMLAKVLMVVGIVLAAVTIFLMTGPGSLVGDDGGMKTVETQKVDTGQPGENASPKSRPEGGFGNPNGGYISGTDLLDLYTEMDAGLELPELKFVGEGGQPVRLSDFDGRVVLLNLWATWCAPCVAEMPTLDALQGEYGGKDFEVVALSFDREGIEAVVKFFEETEINNLRVYADQDREAQNKLIWGGLPMTILIDREGAEIGRVPGPADWFSDDARKMIEDAINAGKQG